MSNKPEFQPFKYNGKEFDMMHGLNTLDYGARQYNSVLPLWDRVDPMVEKNYCVSPYTYCNNDLVNMVDIGAFNHKTGFLTERAKLVLKACL